MIGSFGPQPQVGAFAQPQGVMQRGIGAFAGPYASQLSDEDRSAANRQGLLMTALALLESGGPSRMPVSFGSALGGAAIKGLDASNQYARGALEAEDYGYQRGERQRATMERDAGATTAGQIASLQDPTRPQIGAMLAQSGNPSQRDAGIGILTPPPVTDRASPAGFRPNAAGDLEYIPGGPADPSVVAATRAPAGATQDPALIQEYNLAVKQGYKGTIVEYQADIADAKRADAQSAPTLREFREARDTGLIPKDMTLTEYVGAKAGAVATGRANAEAQVTVTNMLPGARIARDNALSLIDQIAAPTNKAALETLTGNWQGTAPISAFNRFRDQSVQNLSSKIEQLRGSAWLSAYEQLKGGGAIANAEGERAAAAKARLDTRQSEPEFRAALAEFKDALTKGFAALESRAGPVGKGVLDEADAILARGR